MTNIIHYIFHNFSDWDSETKNMGLLEEGIYLRLRRMYFNSTTTNNGKIDASDEELLHYRLGCKTDNEKQALELVLKDKFKKVGNTYRNAKWDKDIKNIIFAIKTGKYGNEISNGSNALSNGSNEISDALNNETTLSNAERQARYRERKNMAKALKDKGITIESNTSYDELVTLYHTRCNEISNDNNGNSNAISNGSNGDSNAGSNAGNAEKSANINKTIINKPITNNTNNTHTQTSEEKNSPVENQSQSEKTKKSPKSEIDSVIVMDWFNQFWEKYPNKISKGQASKTWMKLFLGDSTAKATESPHQLFEQIITGLERNSEYIKNQANRGYVKHASTWLNASGWLDEVTTVQPVAQNSRLPKFGSKDDPLAVNQHWGQPSYVEPNTTPEEWLEMQQAKMKARDLASNRQSQPTGMITL